jgi:Cu(I)/Ag(I) efflux system periplasmic protein CusF
VLDMTTLKTLLCAALLAAAPFVHAADMTEGEVRKIDKETKKITLKHAEIKSLDMPPMTMVFLVKDAALLDGLKPGDKVKFAVERVGTAMVVTEISAVK